MIYLSTSYESIFSQETILQFLEEITLTNIDAPDGREVRYWEKLPSFYKHMFKQGYSRHKVQQTLFRSESKVSTIIVPPGLAHMSSCAGGQITVGLGNLTVAKTALEYDHPVYVLAYRGEATGKRTTKFVLLRVDSFIENGPSYTNAGTLNVSVASRSIFRKADYAVDAEIHMNNLVREHYGMNASPSTSLTKEVTKYDLYPYLFITPVKRTDSYNYKPSNSKHL